MTNKITQVTEADVGRIAVSETDRFRVKILAVDKVGDPTIEYLKPSGENGAGDTTSEFLLVNGGLAMFWEDEIKPAKPMTKFECWCAEKGYDAKGKFVYTKQTPEECVSGYFNKDDVLTLEKDDGSCCPLFMNQEGTEAYEIFGAEDCQLEPYITKPKQAKPRFYKKRQKPPVRLKTDVKLFYKTGEEYTFKNVSAVEFTSSTGLSVEKVNKISKGIAEFSSSRVAWELIDSVTVVSPEGVTFLSVVAEDKFEIIAEKMQAVAHSFYEFYKIK